MFIAAFGWPAHLNLDKARDHMSDYQFSCPACNRSFTWKPELAGKKAKCTCGNNLTVPAEPPEDLVDMAPEPATPQTPAPQEATSAGPQRATCPSCGQSLEPKAILCFACGYNLRTGGKTAAQTSTPVATPATPAPARAPARTRQPSAPTPYPMSHRPTQEEPTGSTTKYVILGSVLLLVAMGVGGWIIFKGTGGADANKPKLGDDAKVEAMIADDYPKDVTEWVEANSARMLGKMNPQQAKSMEQQLKKMGAVQVLAFGPGVLCLCIAVELPPNPAQRQAIFDWHNEGTITPTKDVGQRYLLHDIGI